ncbi:AIG2-like family-domain-containing protein [Yarrowia lipolytica]|nr:AIG2-like family-domain-containing protein [Yarrowia lipolytica]
MTVEMRIDYGTLTRPEVLGRVIANSFEVPAHVKVSPATLHDHVRYHVKNRDYPGVIAKSGASVQGTVAFNLSDSDVAKLDVFEGEDYKRVVVDVDVDGTKVPAHLYLWIGGEDRLDDKEWDVNVFVKEKMDSWLYEELGVHVKTRE